MADRNVLVLALGGTRRRAALEDAARVVAAGGTAVILVDDSATWRNDRPARGVRLVDRSALERRHSWLRWEHLLLYRVPGFAFRKAGDRVWQAYRRRVADRLHRRVFLPLARRGTVGLPPHLIRRYADAAGKLDLLVVNDPASMPAAVALLRTYGRTDAPRVAYGIDEPAGDRQA